MDVNEKHHKDIRIGIYLFCISLDEHVWFESVWRMKIWEGAEALMPYTPVLEG